MVTHPEEALVSVWRQVMVENLEVVVLGGDEYPVRRTSRSRLREVDFAIAGVPLRGVEQNASTHSRWARLAREGRSVMQFLDEGRYLAVVVDGKLTAYGALRERFSTR